MDVNVLKTFVEVMRRGSFAAVARDNDLDPSSVSRIIAGLEDELGLRLFHRSTRKLSPTEAALVYFDRVEPLISELEGARLKAVDMSEKPKGLLRIAAPVSFALLNIVPLLPEFAKLYPDLSFDLILEDHPLDLLEERLDVAIRLSSSVEKGLEALPLARMVSKVCASSAYLKKHGHPKEPSDLAQHACLLLQYPGFSDTWRFRKKNKVLAVNVHGRLHTSNAVALKECALSGMGVILQASWIVGRELKEGTLVDIFPDYEVTAATFETLTAWLVYSGRTYLPLKVKVLIEFLQKRFSGGSPWDSP
ncbi:MAG: LysR family transcriptional regulator [Trueperaceae bacterium]